MVGCRLESAVSSSGGAWFQNVFGSQSFNHQTRDMRMDVTPVVNKWLDGTYSNDGFIVKRSGSFGNLSIDTPEGDDSRLGNFQFFSRETNTIYSPRLEIQWYDAKF